MKLIAITCYFNPSQGSMRRRNYNIFKKHLGIPLLTVEWSQHAHFELASSDADYLIQVSGGDLLWQKERLLNIGLEKVKTMGFEKVVILDSDIVFENPRWYEGVESLLDTKNFIQCFSTARYLPFPVDADLSLLELCDIPAELTIDGLFGQLEKGATLYPSTDSCVRTELTPIMLSGNPGLATAINLRSLCNWVHYEGNVVGGGDLVMLAASSGKSQELFDNISLTPQHQEHIRLWAKSIQSADRVQIGHTPGIIMHLWHGHLKDRMYRRRHSVLIDNQFSPADDLLPAKNGALQFKSSRCELKSAVASYLLGRKDS